MPSTSSQTLKLKSTLRLLIPRLRNAQKKDTAVSITSRREMSVLLSQSREASARIRVENIIQTDICVELMEILELYAELLLARAGLLDAREKEKGKLGSGVDETGRLGGSGADTGLEEAAAAMIYAAPRLPREVRELGIVRAMLVERFGKDFAVRCSADGGGGVVPNRVVEKLRVEPPSQELVEAYLREIARTYGVDWPRPKEEDDVVVDNEAQEQQQREQRQKRQELEEEIEAEGHHQLLLPPPPPSQQQQQHHTSPTASRPDHVLPQTPKPISQVPPARSSPISVAPPAPRSDNPSPKLKLPGVDDNNNNTQSQRDAKQSTNTTTTTTTPTTVARNANEQKSKSQQSQPQPQQTQGPASKGKTAGGDGGDGASGAKIPNVDELSKRFAQLKR